MWTIVNSLHTRRLFGWNSPTDSWEKVKNVKSLQTDGRADRYTDRRVSRKVHFSFQLRWINKSRGKDFYGIHYYMLVWRQRKNNKKKNESFRHRTLSIKNPGILCHFSTLADLYTRLGDRVRVWALGLSLFRVSLEVHNWRRPPWGGTTPCTALNTMSQAKITQYKEKIY